MPEHLSHADHEAIESLLLGRRIVSAEMGEVPIPDAQYSWDRTAEGLLALDDGTRVYAKGNEGGCACSAGDYFLKHLATVDNVITAVRFEDHPGGDDYRNESGDYEYDGWYRIFVAADAVEVNIASFEGSDGNGYYGTGYDLWVQRADTLALTP